MIHRGPEVGNSWRTTGDIHDRYSVYQNSLTCGRCGMLQIVDSMVNIAKHAAPGGFNDLDMLEVGNGGMTHEEYKTHFCEYC